MTKHLIQTGSQQGLCLEKENKNETKVDVNGIICVMCIGWSLGACFICFPSTVGVGVLFSTACSVPKVVYKHRVIVSISLFSQPLVQSEPRGVKLKTHFQGKWSWEEDFLGVVLLLVPFGTRGAKVPSSQPACISSNL